MGLAEILIVDDDFEDRFLIETAFKDLGYLNILSFAENGERALYLLDDAFATKAELPKLVVLDLNMPKMNGTEVLKLIKAHNEFKNIQIVIFSTAINETEKAECIRFGINSYIVKPLSYGEFLNTAQVFYDIALAS